MPKHSSNPRENFMRRILKDDTYEFCKRAPESDLHALWECGIAQDIWTGSSIHLQKCTQGQGNVQGLFEDLLRRLSKAKFEFFIIWAWFI